MFQVRLARQVLLAKPVGKRSLEKVACLYLQPSLVQSWCEAKSIRDCCRPCGVAVGLLPLRDTTESKTGVGMNNPLFDFY